MPNNEARLRKEQGKRLRNAREAAGFRSARAAALENGWAESSYRAHENGSRTIGQDDAEAYAKRFRQRGAKITGASILYDQGATPDKEEGSAPPSPQLTRDEFERLRLACAFYVEVFSDNEGAIQWLEALGKVVQMQGGDLPSIDPSELRLQGRTLVSVAKSRLLARGLKRS